jgi:CBS domain-containing protein
MIVKLIMHTGLFTVDENITIREAAEKMAELNIGAAIVGNQDNITGIISERDFMKRLLAKGLSPDTTLVREIMTKDLIMVKETEAPQVAMKIMDEKKLRHLPVVDESGKCVGMLGVRDLMKYMLDSLEADNEALNFAVDLFK